jgi:RNA polymerase sigma factor (sigma-70 family)
VTKTISLAAEGLHSAHELCDEHNRPLNLVHRDISPDNVRVARNGAVKVVDFGIAKAANQPRLTKSGKLKGEMADVPPALDAIIASASPPANPFPPRTSSLSPAVSSPAIRRSPRARSGAMSKASTRRRAAGARRRARRLTVSTRRSSSPIPDGGFEGVFDAGFALRALDVRSATDTWAVGELGSKAVVFDGGAWGLVRWEHWCTDAKSCRRTASWSGPAPRGGSWCRPPSVRPSSTRARRRAAAPPGCASNGRVEGRRQFRGLRRRPLGVPIDEYAVTSRTHRDVDLVLYSDGSAALHVPAMRDAAGADVVERARSGDAAAFRELYAQHHRQVARQLAFLVPRADLEDVLQDVFVEVFRSIRRFEGKSAFTTWLYRVAVNVAMKARRKRTRSRLDVVEVLPEVTDARPLPVEVALSAERQARVEALLEKLSPKKRAVLVMHDIQGVDAQTIAEVLGTNVLTVRTRLFYARREFEALAKDDPALADVFGGGGS